MQVMEIASFAQSQSRGNNVVNNVNVNLLSRELGKHGRKPASMEMTALLYGHAQATIIKYYIAEL